MAFNELVYLKSRPPVLHELRDISTGLVADQNGCPYLVKKLFDLDPRIDRATEGDEYAMLRYALYKAPNGLADLQVFDPIDLPIHDWWVVFWLDSRRTGRNNKLFLVFIEGDDCSLDN